MAKKIFISLIIFLIVFGFLFLNLKKIEKAEAGSQTIKITAGADDAHERDNGDFFRSALWYVSVSSYTALDFNYYSGGFRFPNINIPPGVIITSAIFRGYASGFINARIYGNNVDNAQDFVVNPNILSTVSRPRTAASVGWVGDFGGVCVWKNSPELQTIIQEIIDRPGWASGNAIVLLFIANTNEDRDCGFDAREFGVDNAAELIISWTSRPTITSVSASTPNIKEGTTQTITPTGQGDADADPLRIYCCQDTTNSCTPTTANTCNNDQAWLSPYAGMTCTLTAPSVSTPTTYYARCRVYDWYTYSTSIVSTSYVVKQELGDSCTTSTDCYSNYCVDGYCCNSICGNACDACNVAGHLGTCWLRPAGEYPECSTCQYCNGSLTTCQPQTGDTGYLCPNPCYNCQAGSCVLEKPPNLYGWAWSENIGWISFNSKNCDLDGDGVMDRANGLPPNGDQGAPAACPPNGTIVKPYGVYLPPGGAEQRNFCGYAWSENIGWIRFDPPPDPVTAKYPDHNVTDCADESPAYLLGGDTTYGLIRACAGAPDPNTCGGGIGANPNSGGWDGWICLDDLGFIPVAYPNYPGVRLSTTFYTCDGQSCRDFERWAWGGGGTSTNGTNAVVGWISFNCKDRKICSTTNQICDFDTDCPGGETCNSQQADGDTACTVSDYKVTYQHENLTPTVSGLQLDGKPKYCNVAPGDGQISFKWTYSDPDNDPQYRFDFQVDNNSDFSSPEVDRRFCNTSSNTQIFLIKSSLVSNPQTYCSGTPDEYTVDTPDAITFNNTSYYWRVKVFDSKGGDSGWVQYNDPADTNEDPDDNKPLTFTTISHAKPWVDFAWCPFKPKTEKTTQFCSIDDSTEATPVCTSTTCKPPSELDDRTDVTCYGIGGGEVACPDTGWTWNLSTFTDDWTFAETGLNGNFTDNSKNPAGQFSSTGGKPVSLTVCDSTPLPEGPYCCTESYTVPVGIELPLPKWKEIPPTF